MPTRLARLKFETKQPPDVASVDSVKTVEKNSLPTVFKLKSNYNMFYTDLWMLTSHIRYCFAGHLYCECFIYFHNFCCYYF